MQPTTKLYAAFTGMDWRTLKGQDEEIADETAAAKLALSKHAICFNTYEVQSVNLGGQELKGEPQNYSARRFVGIEAHELGTAQDFIAKLQADKKTPADFGGDAEMSRMFNMATNGVIKVLKQAAPDAVFIPDRSGDEDMLEVQAGQKVFDKQGQQVYPTVTPATPAVKPSANTP